MIVLKATQPCRDAVRAARKKGDLVGLVPTMGALHEGHLSLIRTAKQQCNYVAVTIFVNPTQFRAGEDFEGYPRTAEEDLAACRSCGVDLVLAPDVATMYPGGELTAVHVPGVTDGLCGANRPGHFDGVATVVVKLLAQAAPDAAFFGEKDYQQLIIIRRVAIDLDLGVRIEGVATARAPDGLAISSRNAYLSAQERAIAPALYATLMEAAGRIEDGADIEGACAQGRAALIAAGFAAVDYLQCVDAVTLEPVTTRDRAARILAAAHLGRARLIDNVALAG